MRSQASRRLILAVGLLAAAAGATWQLWGDPGWPLNHEGRDFAVRTEIYAEHLARLDLLPAWSSLDNHGFGSPQPGLYHKLFYYLSGSLHLVGLSLKTSLALSVAAFLALGGAGMVCLLRSLGTGELPAGLGAVTLMLAGYTTTNWLVRGALSELAGAMLVPWVLWALVETVERSRLRLALPVSLAALFWAHSVLAYFVLLLVAVAVLATWATRRVGRELFVSWRTALGAALFALLVAPAVVVTTVMGDGYDIRRIIPPEYRPENQLRPASDYLFDASWRWGETFEGLSVQLDLPVLVVLGVALYLALRTAGTKHTSAVGPGLWVVAGLAAAGLLLQLGITTPIYEHLPGAAFLQFPWRLLAVVTPALIAVALALAARGASSRVTAGLATGGAVGVALLGGAFIPIDYGRLDLALSQPEQLSTFEEYVPTSYDGDSPVDEVALAARQRRAGCEVDLPDGQDETTSLAFRISCDRSAVVPLASFAHPLHEIAVDGNRARGCIDDVSGWEGLCAVEVGRGEHEVDVALPTGWDVLGEALPG